MTVQTSSIHFLDLVKSRSSQACEVAIASGLRGMDAVVIQVAQEMRAVLVTLDEEIVESVKGFIPTKSVDVLIS